LTTAHEEAKVRFLATLEIARRELALLEYSHSKLFSVTIDPHWVQQFSTDMDGAETLEAFVARFGRLQDTVGGKLIPRALTTLLEKPGAMIDNLSRAEQLGWVTDTEGWITVRELRNRLVHEYVTDPGQFAADIRAAGEFVPMFRKTYESLLELAQDRLGVAEHQLQDYLQPNTSSSERSAAITPPASTHNPS
jgi:hypothetical protein